MPAIAAKNEVLKLHFIFGREQGQAVVFASCATLVAQLASNFTCDLNWGACNERRFKILQSVGP
jgi:hypothetical protein